MSTNEILGTLVTAAIPLGTSIIALLKPIINLNTSITKLNTTMEQLVDANTGINGKLEEHTSELADHETRITLLERR